MERRIAKHVRTHHGTMKDQIKEWFLNKDPEYTHLSEFLQFVYDYPGVEFQKEDFQKRRRVKNTVPISERCIAKRANDEQCTRRKRCGEEFCGTHAKGTPHGTVSDETHVNAGTKNVELWVHDIKGINYYIDAEHNVYSTEDVLAGAHPTVIGHATLNEATGQYSIPELGI